MKRILLVFLISLISLSCRDEKSDTPAVTGQDVLQGETRATAESSQIEINPISHATAVINWGETTIYLDPVGGAEAFSGMDRPDMVLITDIHGDHMSAETLGNLQLGNVPIIAPQAVKDELPDSLAAKITVMNNGEMRDQNGISIEAIPMYNLREEAKQFHPKGRGNGYLLEKDGQRLYIAGDTEDIPEMRNLEDIDIALVPMNLPYTMPVDAAADAVIEFAPEKVYPYHFRGQDGKADVQRFKQLVNEGNSEVEVVMANWYPEDSE
ncbi:MBL fold metallo-hydrolase [Salinimicrobium xinjiangense]|uniref:MBL fold metallo-hydrolase n=1 Tax=Salinimicrobium xinjiangense TaxID=438596 RepID=UPI000400038B|nr:MBL fold metallo-hydrolase [Salinimicrobium xinjiangense]